MTSAALLLHRSGGRGGRVPAPHAACDLTSEQVTSQRRMFESVASLYARRDGERDHPRLANGDSFSGTCCLRRRSHAP